MGGTFYSDEAAEARVADRVAAGKPAVSSYTADIRSGVVASKVHKDLDPKGLVMRESRDSAAHPEAVPVILVLDETGSMESVIRQIQRSVRSIMKLLIGKGYLPHPHIMVMGIGDVPNGETAPLQVSQFEADDKIEQNIDNLYIEGAGGGSNHESYQNAAYVAAYKTSTDHFEKRGQRGYLFIIGDEMNHPFRAVEVRALIGTTTEMGQEIDGLTNETIYAAVRERWNTFFVLPKNASNGGSKVIMSHWKKLLGEEHVLELADENAAGEFVALLFHDAQIAKGSEQALLSLILGVFECSNTKTFEETAQFFVAVFKFVGFGIGGSGALSQRVILILRRKDLSILGLDLRGGDLERNVQFLIFEPVIRTQT